MVLELPESLYVNTVSAKRTCETPAEEVLPGGRDIFEKSVSALGSCGIDAGSASAAMPASLESGGLWVVRSSLSGFSKDVSIPSGSLSGLPGR